jgi:hypothetical protein
MSPKLVEVVIYFNTLMKFEIRMTVTMNSSVFWRVTPCSIVEVCRCFGVRHCLHFHYSLCNYFQPPATSFPLPEDGGNMLF